MSPSQGDFPLRLNYLFASQDGAAVLGAMNLHVRDQVSRANRAGSRIQDLYWSSLIKSGINVASTHEPAASWALL